jgi:hypothetical protein
VALNKQLELFLARCELAYIYDGSLVFQSSTKKFLDAPSYAEGIPRCEDSRLLLQIVLHQNGNIDCSLHTDTEEEDFVTLDSKTFNLVNATLANVEKWLLAANIDATKLYLEKAA